MEKIFRKTGIDIIGDAPWGTHLCQFYQTKKDLIDILVPYFKAGLENNEFCMWITSEPLKVEDAKAALKKVVKNLDHFIKKGQIEILDYSEWYTKSGKFEGNNVLQGWVEKENQALKRGYDGLRLSGNTFWLEKRDWRNFTDYEEEVNNVIGKYRMIAICTYSLDKCGPFEVIDVVSNHQFALIRRENEWVIIESAEYKRVKEGLQESETRYRTLVENLNDAIFIVDMEGRLTYISPAIEHILKYKVTEIVGQPFAKFIHPDDLPGLLDRYKRIFEGEITPYEYRIVDKDGGNIIHIRTHSRPVYKDDRPMGLTGLLTDITKRKQTEEMLRESEEKYRALVESSPNFIGIYQEGVFRYVNGAICERLGWTFEEMTSPSFNPVEKIISWRFQSLAKENIAKRLRGEHVPPYEIIVKTRDGSEIPVIVYAQRILYHGRLADEVILVDITERKRAEEVLRESEKKYRTLFEESRDAIYITTQAGKLVDINKSGLDLFGYNKEEIMNLNVLDTYADSDDRLKFQQEIEQKGFVRDFEVKVKKKDGTEMDCLITATVLRDKEGDILGYQGIIRDITERKRAEEALRESEQKYRCLVELANDGITILQDNVVKYANPYLAEMWGGSVEEVIGTPFTDYIYPDELPRVFDYYKRRITGEDITPIYETVLRRRDGSKVYVELNAGVINFQGKPADLVIIRDITERKQAEEALRESEERYRKLFEDDLTGDFFATQEGTILDCNLSFLKMFGFGGKEEPLNTNFLDLYRSREEKEAFINQLREKKKLEFHECVLLKRDGTLINVIENIVGHFDEQGNLKQFKGYLFDITERKRAEELLEKSEEEAKRLAQENAIMAEIGQIISSTLNIEEVYERFAEEVHKLISFDRVSINIIDPEGRTGTIAYTLGVDVKDRRAGDVFLLIGSVTEEVMRTRSGILVQTEDIEELKTRYPGLLTSFQAGLRSMMSVPLFAKDQVIGSFHIRSLKPNAYLKTDMRLAERVGNQIAGAIANAQLFIERKRKEEEYRIILLTAMDGFWITDMQGRFLDVNDAYCRLIGYSRDELLTMRIQDVEAIESPEDTSQRIEKIMKVGGDRFETRHRCKDGRIIDIEVSVNYMAVNGGRLFVFLRDITERKRAEKALRESEARFRSVFNNAFVGIALVNRQGHVLEANEAYCRFLGYSREELIGMHFAEFTHPEDLSIDSDLYDALAGDERYSCAIDKRYMRKGKVVWGRLAVSLIRDEAGQPEYTIIVCEDITERKRAEETLRRAEKNFRRSLDDSPLGVRIVTTEGETLYANRAILEIYGYDSIEELRTTPVKKRYTPESYAEFQIRKKKRQQGEYDPPEYEISIVRKNNEVRHLHVFRKEVLWNGEKQYQAIYLDITERKWAEEALQESKELFEKTFISQLDAIFLLDAINPPTILDCNPAATEVFGYTRQEMVGRTTDFLHVDETALREFQGYLYQKTAERGFMHLFEFRMKRKDGTVFPTEHSATPLEDEQGKVIGWVSVVRDITERKQAQKELIERGMFNFALFHYNPIQTIAVDLEGKVTVFNLAKKKSGDRLPNIGDVMYKDYARGYEIDMYGELMKCIRSGEIKEFPEQKYGEKVLSIMISPFAKGAIIISQDITERKRAEEKVLTYQEQLRSLTYELSLTEERERRRIATELHDNISQTLAITKIKLGMAQGLTSSTDWVGSLNEIGELIDQAIQYTRSLTFELSPPILYDLGLETGIEWLTEQIQEKHGIQIGFEDDRQPKPMNEEIRLILFKATRELLINIVKHAQASKAKVSIWRGDNSIRIRVEDDGVGFSTPEGKELGRTTGFGLFNIRERIKYLGGDMVIESEPGRGTRVTLSAPLEEKED